MSGSYFLKPFSIYFLCDQNQLFTKRKRANHKFAPYIFSKRIDYKLANPFKRLRLTTIFCTSVVPS